MNGYRPLTKEEFAYIFPALQKCGVQDSYHVRRFVDARLHKVYDVYLLNNNGEQSILKKIDPSEKDVAVYNRYFSRHDFPVPKILRSFSVGDDHFIQMEYADGSDARECTKADGNRIGNALAAIQSHYLTAGGRTEQAERYFKNQIAEQIETVRPYFPAYASVFDLVERRFFDAPQTLIHDDFLPINALINQDAVWIIDWEYAAVLPYFLDLGRFAFVCDTDNRFYISPESAASFLTGYFNQMKKNPAFSVGEKECRLDVAISAFCQYVLFAACTLNTEEQASHSVYELPNVCRLQKIMDHIQSAYPAC